MTQPAAEPIQYFIGMGGEQSGPFLETDILAKIREGVIPQDALVWFEGLTEWQPIQSVPIFRNGFLAPDAVAAVETPVPSLAPTPAPVEPTKAPAAKPAKNSEAEPLGQKDRASSFATSGKSEPVFSNEEAVFTQAPFIRYRVQFIAGGLGLFFLAAVGIFLFNAGEPTETGKKRAAKESQRVSREEEYRKASSELLLSPQDSIKTLRKLVAENANDTFGQQSVETLLEYYAMRSPMEAGQLLMKVDRPTEARKYFEMDPPSPSEIERATFRIYEITADPAAKRGFLVEDIQMLLGPASNPPLAVERIRLLEKNFPGFAHSFGYYLKDTEGKLLDIFNRISFYYVESLLAYLRSELPQIHLTKRPLVQLVREGNNRYRIVGKYDGELLLKQDRLSKMHFEFWLTKGRWSIVETNLTPERMRSGALEKDRLKAAALTASEALQNLEQTFRTEYPKNSLHEAIPVQEKAPARRTR